LEFTAEDKMVEQTTSKNTISEGYEKDDFKIQKGNSYKRKIDLTVKYVSLYSRLEKILLKKIDNEKLNKLYDEIEGPLIKILAYIEYVGVNIDRKYLRSLIKEYEVNINRLTEDIYKLCGCNFNINSPQQLAKILYSKLNLPAVKKTKTGFSTNAGTLLAIFDRHPVIEKILNYREKVKLKNTYIDVLPSLINSRDNRIHTTYNQLGTSTGRISSSKPNLQNIPVRTDLGRQIRKAFIPGKNYDLLMSADYSQIELRVLAHLSEDEDLIEAFNLGEDIHKRTASEIFSVPYNEVDENLRRKAKAINFGIIYGMTEYGLKSRLSISEDEAREYIKMYFNRYQKVRKYIDTLISSTYKNGYTTTIFGRKRYIRELSSGNINIRNLGERLAVNTPIQGSAADIMKLSTIILFNELQSVGIDSNIILHVHDELVLELKKDDLNKVEKIVRNSLENCIELKVGLEVDIKTGKNWYI
jgi:DNA polymerase-1